MIAPTFTTAFAKLASRLTVLLAVLFVAVPTLAGAAELKITDIKVGDGEEAQAGKRVIVHYTGWLMDGTKFDSSVDRGEPFEFDLGRGRVIQGWDRGVEGMRVGGKRELIIPPELGYGARGAGRLIPPGATLKFEVELLGFAVPKYTNVDNAALKDLLARGVKIIDIRRAEEWAQTGVVDGSELITAFNKQGQIEPSFLQKFTTAAKPHEEVILICRTGNRTRAVAQAMSERFGYEKIYNVTNGITQWIKDGNPVVKAN